MCVGKREKCERLGALAHAAFQGEGLAGHVLEVEMCIRDRLWAGPPLLALCAVQGGQPLLLQLGGLEQEAVDGGQLEQLPLQKGRQPVGEEQLKVLSLIHI